MLKAYRAKVQAQEPVANPNYEPAEEPILHPKKVGDNG